MPSRTPSSFANAAPAEPAAEPGQGRRIRLFVATHLAVAGLALGVAFTIGADERLDPVPASPAERLAVAEAQAAARATDHGAAGATDRHPAGAAGSATSPTGHSTATEPAADPYRSAREEAAAQPSAITQWLARQAGEPATRVGGASGRLSAFDATPGAGRHID